MNRIRYDDNIKPEQIIKMVLKYGRERQAKLDEYVRDIHKMSDTLNHHVSYDLNKRTGDLTLKIESDRTDIALDVIRGELQRIYAYWPNANYFIGTDIIKDDGFVGLVAREVLPMFDSAASKKLLKDEGSLQRYIEQIHTISGRELSIGDILYRLKDKLRWFINQSKFPKKANLSISFCTFRMILYQI